jgi:3-deoxy-manno-octulosonate cytidylyltransferase (CMP-KDO synthetase)
MSNILGIIPSRYGSTRFPGKPLVDIAGKSLVQRVYEQTSKSTLLTEVVVATDDQRIFDHVLSFGGKAIMTSDQHPTGTDRCVEVAKKMGNDFDFFVNIQGDEPFIDPKQIDGLCELFLTPTTEIGTMMKAITDPAEIFDMKEVKITFNKNMEALYMSRSAIPYIKDVPESEWYKHHTFYKHIGIYGFRKDVLIRIADMRPTILEKLESLEQLRWQDEFKISLGITDIDTLSIDTPEDLKEVIKYL